MTTWKLTEKQLQALNNGKTIEIRSSQIGRDGHNGTVRISSEEGSEPYFVEIYES